jgi:hypothetical protein
MGDYGMADYSKQVTVGQLRTLLAQFDTGAVIQRIDYSDGDGVLTVQVKQARTIEAEKPDRKTTL